MVSLAARALPIVLAAAPSRIQLLNWDRMLVQDVHLVTVTLFVSAAILPFLLPLALNLPWIPAWFEAASIRRLRRCLLSGSGLLLAASLLVGLAFYRPEAVLGVSPEYFTAAATVPQQYEGLFGIRPGVPVATQTGLAIAAIATAPILGALIAGLFYKTFEWTLSLKARARHLVR